VSEGNGGGNGSGWGGPRDPGSPMHGNQQPWNGGGPTGPGGVGNHGYLTPPLPTPPEPGPGKPWYRAPFIGSFRRFWKQYAMFSGRSSRAEYWWTALAIYLATMIVEIPYMVGFFVWTFTVSDQQLNEQIEPSANPFQIYAIMFRTAPPVLVVGVVILAVWSLGIIVPQLALGARRLHDSNKSGWWLLLGLVPFVGSVVLIVFFCLEPDQRGHRFDRHG
jgi:uncharacterized membrane protein YhaH (DUF805 family)